MSSNIVTVIILRLVIAQAAPIHMTLLQQLQGLTQQMTLNQMTQQQTPLQQMTQDHMPIHQMMQTQFPLQEIQQPMTMPLLQPLQGTAQQQRLALQEQMFALQQFQALQRMGLVPSPMSLNTQPILVLYPDYGPKIHTHDLKANRYKHETMQETGDDDSEIIDAASTEKIEEIEETHKMKAVLLMPNNRGILGSIIEQIPFLPFEINVPDTIAWIYNGIAGIIAGLGQRLPFRPQTPTGETPSEGNVKSIWNTNRQKLPIVVMPLGR